MYKIYSVKNYAITKDSYEKYVSQSDNIDDICDLLDEDKSYHLRFTTNKQYKFIIDVDNYDDCFDMLINDLILFLKDKYDIDVNKSNVCYTKGKAGSYHLTIPKLYASLQKQKEIINNFKKHYDYDCVDSCIYSDRWFRLPYQTKGMTKNKNDILTPHIICNGNIKNFISDYIEKNSICIENVKYVDDIPQKDEIFVDKHDLKPKNENINNNNNIKGGNIVEIETIQKLLNILDSKYYNDFSCWINIMLILKQYEKNTKCNMFDIFCEFSKKSKKYDNKYIIDQWGKYLNEYDIKMNIGSLFYYAKQSNITEYRNIVKCYHDKNKIEISEKYLSETIKLIGGNYFLYTNNTFYAYDHKLNFWYYGDEAKSIIKRFMGDELYEYIKSLLNDLYDHDQSHYKDQHKILNKYCKKNKEQEQIYNTFKNIYFNEPNEVIFDDKYYLLGFNNGVYDIRSNTFRNYKYDDFMTTKTGYNYKKANNEEIQTIYELYNKIEVNKEKNKFLFEVLSTCLLGRCYQKFFIFSGSGANGKSTTTSLMQSVLGNYFYKAKVSCICESDKSGGNPEIANMNKKRMIVMTEPTNQKIDNGMMKQLTGDKTINARQLFSNNTVCELNGTFILECNKKIFFKEEINGGEKRRVIDYSYESKFVENDTLIDNKTIFKANQTFNNSEFIEKHKYAMLNILISIAHEFLNNGETHFIPSIVQDKTNEYFNDNELNMKILKEFTIKTNDKNDMISINDLYDKMKISDYYLNMTKNDKRDISKKKLIDFYSTKDEIKNNYLDVFRDRKKGNNIFIRNVLCGYKFNDCDENCENDEFDDGGDFCGN
jgi:phage/plasmid-associated DNA primase